MGSLRYLRGKSIVICNTPLPFFLVHHHHHHHHHVNNIIIKQSLSILYHYQAIMIIIRITVTVLSLSVSSMLSSSSSTSSVWKSMHGGSPKKPLISNKHNNGEKFKCQSGCKENHFYSLPFRQAEANIY